MKKILTILLVLTMCFSLCSCGGPSDTEIKIGVPFTMGEGEEYTFTGIRAGMVANGSKINLTFKIDVDATNNTGEESTLYGMSRATLYNPNGEEITVHGNSLLTLGDTACGLNNVLDGGSKSYSLAYLNPEILGEYKLMYTDDFYGADYTFTFTLDKITDGGDVVITYPTKNGTQTYESDIANLK